MLMFDLILLVLSIGMILLGIHFLNHKRVQENLKQVVVFLGGALVLSGIIGVSIIIML